MTREEAKHRLLNIERCTPIHTREDVRDFEALEMAIQALEQEPSGDLISRQSVLNACEQSINIIEAVDRITDLPSVEQEPSEDCIKRQAVLDAIHEAYMNTYDEQSLVRDLTQAVNELPPVNPQESKTGHWISLGVQGEVDGQIVQVFTCSECGAISIFRLLNGNIVNGDLCPNCGAKMVDEQERSEE